MFSPQTTCIYGTQMLVLGYALILAQTRWAPISFLFDHQGPIGQ